MNYTNNSTVCNEANCSQNSYNQAATQNASTNSYEGSKNQVDMHKYVSIPSHQITSSSKVDPIEAKIQRDLQNLTSCYYEDNDTLSKKYNSYGGQIYNKDIMEQSHADNRSNQYMNQTSAHVNPIDPVYNMQHQALVTPSNVGPEYNQQLNFCIKNEDYVSGKRELGVQDRLGLKGNVGKCYLMSDSQTHVPQACTSHIIPSSGEISHIDNVTKQSFTSPEMIPQQSHHHHHSHDLKQKEKNVRANFDKVEDMY